MSSNPPRPTPWPRELGGFLFRDPTEADIPVLLSFRNDPVVNHFMLHTHVEPEQFRRDWLAIPTSATDFSCVVEDAGEVVAMGFLEIVDGSGQPGHPTGTEGLIGYIVRPDAAGRGIGTATAHVLLAAAFEDLGLRRVTAGANADNIPSVRILERAGMRRECYAVKAYWHHELGWSDGVEYALLAEEWALLQQGRTAGAAGATT